MNVVDRNRTGKRLTVNDTYISSEVYEFLRSIIMVDTEYTEDQTLQYYVAQNTRLAIMNKINNEYNKR